MGRRAVELTPLRLLQMIYCVHTCTLRIDVLFDHGGVKCPLFTATQARTVPQCADAAGARPMPCAADGTSSARSTTAVSRTSRAHPFGDHAAVSIPANASCRPRAAASARWLCSNSRKIIAFECLHGMALLMQIWLAMIKRRAVRCVQCHLPITRDDIVTSDPQVTVNTADGLPFGHGEPDLHQKCHIAKKLGGE